jgi:hypothetical protein
MLAAVVVGTKVTDDKYFSNKYFAECGGVSLAEMNALEISLLRVLRFGVHVTPKDFFKMQAIYLNTSLSSVRVRPTSDGTETPAADVAVVEQSAVKTVSPIPPRISFAMIRNASE